MGRGERAGQAGDAPRKGKGQIRIERILAEVPAPANR